jgi:hypothetical protein
MEWRDLFSDGRHMIIRSALAFTQCAIALESLRRKMNESRALPNRLAEHFAAQDRCRASLKSASRY